jgi:hypothetical protein
VSAAGQFWYLNNGLIKGAWSGFFGWLNLSTNKNDVDIWIRL